MRTHKQRRKAHNFKRILYVLRRQYGVPAALYEATGSLNVETGDRNESVTKTDIPLLVSWDVSFVERIPTHSLGNFNYGFNYEVGDRVILLDKCYLCDTFELRPSHYFVIDNLRFNVVKYTALDFGVGYIVQVRYTNNQSSRQVIDVSINQYVTVEQELSDE